MKYLFRSAIPVGLFILGVPSWAQWICPGGLCYTNGRVGIGTANPIQPMHIKAWGSGSTPWAQVFVEAPAANSDAAFAVRSTHLSTSQDWYFGAGSGAGATSNYFRIVDVTAGNKDRFNITPDGDIFLGGNMDGSSSSGANVVIRNNGHMGIQTLNPQYELTVAGTIGTKDLIVTNTTWADIVFKPGYNLRPLGEVSTYIRKHRHLPGMPSEGEVAAHGVSIGDMQVKLLTKIEELTLHMIEVNERNDRLERQNEQLQRRVAKLEKATPGR